VASFKNNLNSGECLVYNIVSIFLWLVVFLNEFSRGRPGLNHYRSGQAFKAGQYQRDCPYLEAPSCACVRLPRPASGRQGGEGRGTSFNVSYLLTRCGNIDSFRRGLGMLLWLMIQCLLAF